MSVAAGVGLPELGRVLVLVSSVAGLSGEEGGDRERAGCRSPLRCWRVSARAREAGMSESRP